MRSLALALALLVCTVWGVSNYDNLKQNPIVHVWRGSVTNGIRHGPRPALKCLNCNEGWEAMYFKCRFDHDDLWSCEHDEDKIYKVIKYDVVCEKYNVHDADDIYGVVQGSCGVEYSVQKVEIVTTTTTEVFTYGATGEEVLFAIVYLFIFFLALVVIVAACTHVSTVHTSSSYVSPGYSYAEPHYTSSYTPSSSYTSSTVYTPSTIYTPPPVYTPPVVVAPTPVYHRPAPILIPTAPSMPTRRVTTTTTTTTAPPTAPRSATKFI